MGWVEALSGKIVGVDTAPFIYYMEDSPVYADMLEPVFQAATRGDISLVTSTLTLLEVLVLPIRKEDTDLAQQYRDILFKFQGLACRPITRKTLEAAARLRAFHTIRTPDSIQMATAINAGASFFLTNDIKLPSLPNLLLDKLRTEPSS